MLKDILAVSGKPGLYRLVSEGKNMSIVESLTDKKRMPTFTRDKIISLSSTSIFIENGQTSVGEVLNSIKEKEEGRNISVEYAKASPDELRAYLAEVLPDFDRERVYPNDIRKLLKWYDLLITCGISDFSIKEEEDAHIDETKAENETSEESEKTAATVKIVQPAKSTPNKNIIAIKPSKAIGPKPMPKSAAPKKSVVGAKRGS